MQLVRSHPPSHRILLCSVELYEGYGQTECSAAATLTVREDVNTVGHVGIPFACNDVKLVSVEEMGYRYDDKVHGVQLNPVSTNIENTSNVQFASSC